MTQNRSRSGGEASPGRNEPSSSLSRVDLAMLLAAERRLAEALARPAEVHRFTLLAVEQAAALLMVDRAILCLVDRDEPRYLRVVAGMGGLADEEGELLPVDGSLEGRVLSGTEPVRTPDLDGEKGIYRPRIGQRRAGPAVAAPLRFRDRAIGVLLVAREPGGPPFLERDAELLREFTTPITSGIEAMQQFDLARRSRESVEAWTREQTLRRWIQSYEAIAAARIELVFRAEPAGTLEWGGSTDPLFGVPARQFAPRVEDLLARIHGDDREAVRKAFESVMNPSGAQSVSVGCGLLIRDGSIERKQLTAWRSGEGGDVIGMLAPEVWAGAAGVEGEVTEAIGGPEAIAENIVRTLRHEINNPLAAVIGRAQLMIREDSVQSDPMLRQSVETILFESERISRFVQQLHNLDGLSRLSQPLPGDTRKAW